MIYMIAHPEVQDKAHDELDRMIGSDRLITVADRSQLHYVNCIVHVCCTENCTEKSLKS